MGYFGGGTETPTIKQPIDLVTQESALPEHSLPQISAPEILPEPQAVTQEPKLPEHSLPQIPAPEILVLVPEPQADPESRVLIAILLMAGSLFWAVSTFLNRAHLPFFRPFKQ